MADNPQVQEIIGDAVKKVGKSVDPKNLSLEAILLLVTAERLHRLEDDSRRELKELQQRQQKVAFLNKLIKTINTATSKEGDFDCTSLPDLQDMIKEAKNQGVPLDETKQQYNDDERERLVENIRMTIDDLNIQNEMQLQQVTRMTNERYESYQMARNILKPLHDDKLNKARAIAGR